MDRAGRAEAMEASTAQDTLGVLGWHPSPHRAQGSGVEASQSRAGWRPGLQEAQSRAWGAGRGVSAWAHAELREQYTRTQEPHKEASRETERGKRMMWRRR